MIRTYLNIITACLLISVLGACGVSKRTAAPPSNTGKADPPTLMAVNKYEEREASLMQAYRDWKGTPYRLGGRSQQGVDCSSFISIVFDRYFGISLPSNTRELMREGNGIRRAALQTGDLVFFRTGRGTLHAGIVIDEEQFLHASTSQGVTLSSLYDRYWATKYLAARRVF